MGRLKTVLLMIGLMLLFIYVGNLVGGEQGMMVAFLIACGINFFSYFFYFICLKLAVRDQQNLPRGLFTCE